MENARNDNAGNTNSSGNNVNSTRENSNNNNTSAAMPGAILSSLDSGTTTEETTTTTTAQQSLAPVSTATSASPPAQPLTSTSEPTAAPATSAPVAASSLAAPPCQRDITPMMVPDPMCPNCHSEFVEKIEADNDPRTFVQPAPQHPPGQAGDHGPGEPINLEDLFHLFQAVSNPQRVIPQHQHLQQQRHPGQMYNTGAQIIFNSGPMGITRTVTTSGPGSPPTSSQGTHAQGTAAAQGPGQDAVQGAQSPQWHSPPAFISGLGIELHYTTDPAALSSREFGSPLGGGGGGFFPVVGNPSDYAWGQGGLDDIITQLMDLQNRQHGPVGATDEIINGIPHHTLTNEELEAKLECTVCKDEFTKEGTLLQLPCQHIFHEDCIKPWLKVSGTCPTCRFSLVGGQDDSQPGQAPPAPGSGGPGSVNQGPAAGSGGGGGGGGGNNGASGTAFVTRLPGAFPSNTSGPTDGSTTGNANASNN
ncbi:hypothetical protein BG011_008589 [Mortierella polycephala]|uniref:RING-type domain-containing protein n=1 Tax=Mortierella polycephala TaxID=41804 RepID=A0A9P6PPF4_9FUNG|nr:hypothetical protein BG011_008589 [Mortierella polycephala]